MKVNVFLSIIFPLLLFSCEEAINWDRQKVEDPRLVIQAILTNEPIHQQILLGRASTSPNGGFGQVSDARVWVESQGKKWDFLLDTAIAGNYMSEIPFGVKDSQDYELFIEWEGKTYHAKSRLSKVLPLTSFELDSVKEEDSLLSLNSLGDIFDQGNGLDPGSIFDPSQNAMYEVWIDWSHLGNSTPNQAITYFYTFKSIHINELIRPRREPLTFPKGSILTIKKFGLNEDFAFFLKSMLIETEWNGNLYFSQASNVPSNIQPDALGFFSTCAVLTDTLIAE